MKITLVGRPGVAVQRGTTVVTTMLCRSVPALPHELPEVPEGAVAYTVLIPSKQWERVSVDLHNPLMRLIIDGYCAYDAEYKGLVVFAQSAATRLPPPPKPARAPRPPRERTFSPRPGGPRPGGGQRTPYGGGQQRYAGQRSYEPRSFERSYDTRPYDQRSFEPRPYESRTPPPPPPPTPTPPPARENEDDDLLY